MPDSTPELSPLVFSIDEAAEVERISDMVRSALAKDLKRRGVVVAMSGGIDSSVCAAVAVHAIGSDKVHGLILPESDSDGSSRNKAETLARQLEIRHEVTDITPILHAMGCYSARDTAIRRVFPNYTEGWKSKIVLHGGLEGRLNHFQLVVQSLSGDVASKRLRLPEYLQIVAATNFKQRVRKTLEYFHADRLNYAVIGTPNRLEFDQGFFVKNGDGSADIKPIAHLYKTQVYSLGRYLKLPQEILDAPPTTDTYSLPQGQDEFYFALPYDQMDLALWAYNHDFPSSTLARVLEISAEKSAWVYKDIERKRLVARYLHASPIGLAEPEA